MMARKAARCFCELFPNRNLFFFVFSRAVGREGEARPRACACVCVCVCVPGPRAHKYTPAMRGLIEYSSSSGGDGDGEQEDDGAAPPATTSPPPRVRSFPHVAGQFAVHTHVPVEVGADLADRLRALVGSLAPAVPGLTLVDALRPPPVPPHAGAAVSATAPPSSLHMSLSRVAPVPSRDVPTLTDGLAATLTEAPGLPRAGFQLRLATLVALVNDDATQCFLAAAAAEPDGAGDPAAYAAFGAAIAAVDAAGALVGVPPFYDRPSPHVSFAWAPGGSAAALRAEVERLAWTGPPWVVPVRRIACRVGKRVVVVWRSATGRVGEL